MLVESTTVKLAPHNRTCTLYLFTLQPDHVDLERLTGTPYANVLTWSMRTCVVWFNSNQGEHKLEQNDLQGHYLMFLPVLTNEIRK